MVGYFGARWNGTIVFGESSAAGSPRVIAPDDLALLNINSKIFDIEMRWISDQSL